MKNAINWFELGTRDMDRAIRFWEATLGKPLRREVFGGVPHAIFPHEDAAHGVTGALVPASARSPGPGGALIYFDCADGVPATLARAEAAGASVVQPATSIGEHGWIAIVRDLDGNEVGLHAGK